jgi:hypothetical protein
VIGGLRLSGVVQAYSSLPFNVTSGVNTLQGTAGRPMVNGEFIPRNAGVADRFFTANARISRMFGGAGKRCEVFAEVFNLTNRTNVTAVNGNFGSGTYPTAPSPAFGQPTAVGDPRSWQFGARVSF